MPENCQKEEGNDSSGDDRGPLIGGLSSSEGIKGEEFEISLDFYSLIFK